MTEIAPRFLMVSMDLMPEGFSFQCWISIDRPNGFERTAFPYVNTYMGDTCTWFIYSSHELTPKILHMAGEQADRICAQGKKVFQNRVAVNQ